FGQPIDHPSLQSMTAHGTGVFGEAVRMVGDALGIELDEVRCVAEYAQTTEDLDLGSWTIPAGCLAGVYASWQGMLGGRASSRSTCAGERARPWCPTGRPSGTAGSSRWRGAPPSR